MKVSNILLYDPHDQVFRVILHLGGKMVPWGGRRGPRRGFSAFYSKLDIRFEISTLENLYILVFISFQQTV